MLTLIFDKLGFNKAFILIVVIIVLNIFVFAQILALDDKSPEIYFLDVGQGDSELFLLPGGVQVLIDGGPPNGRVVTELSEILPFTDRYIDLVILTHSQLDHFGGLIQVLDTYRVGAFLWNGRRGTTSAFEELERVIALRNVPVFVVGARDKISYRDGHFNILSPDNKDLLAKDLNDTSIVAQFIYGEIKAFFTGDIGKKVERKLAETFDLSSNILKVSHHGSKFSSSDKFLSAVTPTLAIIQVGKNSYGHPTSVTLNRLAGIGAKVFRTDSDGTIKLTFDNGGVKIFR